MEGKIERGGNGRKNKEEGMEGKIERRKECENNDE